MDRGDTVKDGQDVASAPSKKLFEQRDSSNKRLGQGLGKWWEKEVSVQARSLKPV